MDRLTKEEIADLRECNLDGQPVVYLNTPERMRQLCNLALQSLSQESVRSEALADMFAMIDEGLLVRDISKDHLSGWAARQITFVQRLAKNKTALQSPARVAEEKVHSTELRK